MQTIKNPSGAQYRLIIRDEDTNASKSFGIYNVAYNLEEILIKIKSLIEEAEKKNGI